MMCEGGGGRREIMWQTNKKRENCMQGCACRCATILYLTLCIEDAIRIIRGGRVSERGEEVKEG